MGFATRKFPFESESPLDFEIFPVIEGHKITLKPELPIVPWVTLGKWFNGEGRAQKYSIIKCKWFIQE